MYLSRSFLSVLIVTSSFIIAAGQTTPEPRKDSDKVVRSFSMSFDSNSSYLGVQTTEVNRENFSKFGLSAVRGVAVEKVMENSPASAAGLQAGDVIVRFNNEEVTGARKLTRLVGEVDPDHQARITIVRNGREQELTATLAKRPMPELQSGSFKFPGLENFDLDKLKDIPDLRNLPDMPNLPDMDNSSPRVFSLPNGQGRSFMWRSGEGRQIGIGVTSMTPQLAKNFGVDAGVLINNVKDDSPASRAGLKAGDVIVEIDSKAVKSHVDLIRSINDKKEGDITLTYVRDTTRQTVTITPEKSKDSGFMFQTGDDDNGLFPPSPPSAPMRRMIPGFAPDAAPMIPPSPMTLILPGRVI